MMGLKSDVVLVNEYSVPLPNGKGSRGGTPGAYVERYMAREQATETLAPITRGRTDHFIERYMARESAVERLEVGATDPAAEPILAPSQARLRAKREMRQAQGDGGVAFGYGQVSLADEQLKAASKDIQHQFADNGKTVLKTVLSFSHDYLTRHGIVAPGLEINKRGDYRGHIDQMKLRMAIMHGLDRMAQGAGGFDDLRYVGVIQVDTEHVHCHLAMVDAGVGHVTRDGTQRGKLLDRHKSRLRRGIDAWLDEKQTVAHLSSAVGYERRNVTTFIKRWAHEKIRAESLPQFLTACLPADRRLWRAGTNDQRMRKANRLVTDLVIEQLERSGSPLPEAIEKITDYADHRRDVEGLGTEEWQQLIERGRRQLLERAVNSVYGMLRALPAEELTVRTPMLQVMSMNYEEMALLAASREQERGTATEDPAEGTADLVSFGFRLRSYASRLAHHKEKSGIYRDLAKQWERADHAEVASADSLPLYEFYRYEEGYHRRLLSKYQHFLPLLGDKSGWAEQQQKVAAYGQRLLSLTAMRADATLQRMQDPAEAEHLGREIYDQAGGRHLTEGAAGRDVLDQRITTMQRSYDEQVDQLRADLAGSGLVLKTVENRQGETLAGEGLEIREGAQHPFEAVKTLDLHHLGYDFTRDAEVGRQAAQLFVAEAHQRRRLLLVAMQYLDASGQSEAIADLPVDDVAAMMRTARTLEAQHRQFPDAGTSLLTSRLIEVRAEQARAGEAGPAARRSRATSLDAVLVLRVRAEVNGVAGDVALRGLKNQELGE
jgi:hypothetical protein